MVPPTNWSAGSVHCASWPGHLEHCHIFHQEGIHKLAVKCLPEVSLALAVSLKPRTDSAAGDCGTLSLWLSMLCETASTSPRRISGCCSTCCTKT